METGSLEWVLVARLVPIGMALPDLAWAVEVKTVTAHHLLINDVGIQFILGKAGS